MRIAPAIAVMLALGLAPACSTVGSEPLSAPGTIGGQNGGYYSLAKSEITVEMKAIGGELVLDVTKPRMVRGEALAIKSSFGGIADDRLLLVPDPAGGIASVQYRSDGKFDEALIALAQLATKLGVVEEGLDDLGLPGRKPETEEAVEGETRLALLSFDPTNRQEVAGANNALCDAITAFNKSLPKDAPGALPACGVKPVLDFPAINSQEHGDLLAKCSKGICVRARQSVQLGFAVPGGQRWIDTADLPVYDSVSVISLGPAAMAKKDFRIDFVAGVPVQYRHDAGSELEAFFMAPVRAVDAAIDTASTTAGELSGALSNVVQLKIDLSRKNEQLLKAQADLAAALAAQKAAAAGTQPPAAAPASPAPASPAPAGGAPASPAPSSPAPAAATPAAGNPAADAPPVVAPPPLVAAAREPWFRLCSFPAKACAGQRELGGSGAASEAKPPGGQSNGQGGLAGGGTVEPGVEPPKEP